MAKSRKNSSSNVFVLLFYCEKKQGSIGWLLKKDGRREWKGDYFRVLSQSLEGPGMDVWGSQDHQSKATHCLANSSILIGDKPLPITDFQYPISHKPGAPLFLPAGGLSFGFPALSPPLGRIRSIEMRVSLNLARLAGCPLLFPQTPQRGPQA